MVRVTILFSLIALGLTDLRRSTPATPVGCPSHFGVDPAPNSVATPTEPPRLAPNRFYSGSVAELGADWVDLAPGWDGSRFRDRPKPQDDTAKRLRFRAAGEMIAGDVSGCGYRLVDLKIGDIVVIDSGVTKQGEVYCLKIDIRRRPKGKIPPVPVFGHSRQTIPTYGIRLSKTLNKLGRKKGFPFPQSISMVKDDRCGLTHRIRRSHRNRER